MKLKKIMISLGLIAALSSTSAFAQEFKAVLLDSSKTAALVSGLKKSMPDMGKVDEVLTTPLPGIYEVRLDRSILYSNEAGTYFMNGHIIEGSTQRNLTKEKLEKLSSVEFNSLPFGDAIKIVHGTGARKIAVFADPNCGYCKRFEQTLNGVDNITIYTFLIPILGDDSIVKSRNIWCSKDRAKAWTNWMINAVPVESAKNEKCNVDAVVRNVSLAKRYGVKGTPGIFFEDGSRYPGAMQIEELNKKLDGMGSPKIAKK